MKKYLLIVFIFCIDVVLKQIVQKTSDDIFLIPQLLAFKLFRNPVLAFNIYSHPSLIIIMSSLIILILIIWVYKKPQYFFPIALICFGAISNLWDRIIYGFVVDYFYLWPMSYFNLADLMIFSGAIWLIIKLSKK